MVKQGSLPSSDQVPPDNFSLWLPRGTAQLCEHARATHYFTKSLALGKAWIRTRPFESTDGHVLENNEEVPSLRDKKVG